MKLFLSSIRLPNSQERAALFGNKNNLKVLIVPNAYDTYPEDRQKAELARIISEFKELGYNTSVLDLVTSSDQQRRDRLYASDFLWITGGNTFYLNYRVQRTGFDKLIRDTFSSGLVYGGNSAGAIIAGPSLHGTENADDPNDAPEIIWNGMHLVDLGIVPHWGMEKYGQSLEKMKAEMEPYVPQLVTLTNDQAALVLDGELSIS